MNDSSKAKKTEVCTVRMTREMATKLEEHCRLTGQTKTVAIERALDIYIDKMKERFE